MSFGKSILVKDRTEVKINEKATLIVPPHIVEKIDYLHSKFNVEWSGVLLYSTVGDIRDPEGLTLTIEDFILMDVGTSAYTEYDFDADDPAAFHPTEGFVGRAMDNNWKIGHCHTHHTMNIYFSGTDTDELHENAPKHNYYLSLIVGIGLCSRWKAQIAYVGEIVTTGIKDITSDITIATTWNGPNGPMEEIANEETSVQETIDNTEKLLNLVELNIEAEDIEVVDENPLAARIVELHQRKADKAAKVAAEIAKRLPAIGYQGRIGINRWNKNMTPLPKYTKPTTGVILEEIPGMGYMNEDFTIESTEENYELAKADGFFNFEKVEKFLAHFIVEGGEDLLAIAKVVATKNIKLSPKSEAAEKEFKRLVAYYSDEFLEEAETSFGVALDNISQHALAVACLDVLGPYKKLKFYSVMETAFASFIFTKEEFDVELDVRTITGIIEYKQI